MAPSWSLGSALRGMFARGKIDDETWDDLEDALISRRLRPRPHRRDRRRAARARSRSSAPTTPPTCSGCCARPSRNALAKLDPTLTLSNRPAVVLVVGVNGVGKTTTIGKFAKFLRNYGRTVVVGAADTFRAAAVEQLATWAERGGRARSCARSSQGRIRLPSPSRPSRRRSATASRSC